MRVILLVGLILLVEWFFERRIGGSGGGSEKAIVGVIWMLAAIGMGVLMARVR